MPDITDPSAPAPAGGVRTAALIVDEAGGPAEIALALDLTKTRVVNWRANGVPDTMWDRFVARGWASRAELRAASILAGVKKHLALATPEELRARLTEWTGGPRSIRDMVKHGGGPTRIGEALNCSHSTVSVWQKSGPPKDYWERFVELGLAWDTAEVQAACAVLRPAKAAAASPAPALVSERQQRLVRGETGGLSAFVRLIDVPGTGPGKDLTLAAHQRLWIEKLEAVERGEIRRLMGFMPPGSAKSTYAVDVFTPWFLGRGKNRSVLCVTYATALAGRRGRKARSVTRQPVFQALFDAGPEKGRASVVDWGLSNGGEWMGAGMLAGITGNRADLIVIDDPVKGRAEADSELIRRRTREEFDDTVRTRLKAGGRIVLIQTRWHEDDLAGSLLPVDYDGRSGPVLCRDGETWEVVSIPAQAERADDPLGRSVGEYLWPEYWGADHWPQFRLNPRTWNALYQQRPRPEEGGYFERGCFKRFQDQELPKLRYYGTSDYAVTDGGGDFTRLTVWGVDRFMNLWRVGSWGGQTSSEQWIERQCDLIADYRGRGGIRRWFGEAGVIQRAVEPMLKAKMKQRKLSCALEWLGSGQDKVARARGAQSLVREGRIHVRDDGDGDCFIDECVAFPAGRYDDEVDCLSLIGRVIDRLEPPVEHWRKLPEFYDDYDMFDPEYRSIPREWG